MRTSASRPPRSLVNLSLVAAFLAAAGCSTASKSTVTGAPGSAEGQWRGRGLVKNTRTGKSGTVTLDILAREPGQLRMEVIGSFGVHLASVALNNGETRAVLTRERRFVSAPAHSDALIGLVPIRVPPAALLAILFDRSLPSSDWKCATSPEPSCAHLSQPVQIKWVERDERSRRLRITAPDADVELVLQEAPSAVATQSEAFVLSAPEGYTQQIYTRE